MMKYTIKRDASSSVLKHHGIRGQKWGVRRYQNPDGTLTESGKKRYGRTYEEVEQNYNNAKNKVVALRRRSDDLNSRHGLYAVLTTNDIKNAHAARKAVKAEKKAAEYERILNGMKDHIEAKKAEDKKAFDSARKDIRRKGMHGWLRDTIAKGDTATEDSFFDHVWNSQRKLLDKWWDERDEVRSDDKAWTALQLKYSKQLASNLGLPQTSDTYEFCADWFFTGDD